MPGCTTCGNNKAFGIINTINVLVETAEFYPALLSVHTSAKRVFNRLRLFINFFQHKMLKAALLNHFERELQLLYFMRFLYVTQGIYIVVAVAINDSVF